MATSVERVSQAIERLSSRPEGILIGDLAEEMALSRSATASLLDSLVESGLAERDSSKRYLLTQRLYTWTARAANRFLPSSAIRLETASLAEQVKHPVLYSILDGAWTVTLERTDWRSYRAVTVPSVGRFHWSSNATGVVLVAFETPESIGSILEDGSWNATGSSNEGIGALRDELTLVREQGFAERRLVDGYGVAAPLLGPQGRCVAAVGIITRNYPPPDRDLLVTSVVDVAGRCSVLLGYDQLVVVP